MIGEIMLAEPFQESLCLLEFVLCYIELRLQKLNKERC